MSLTWGSLRAGDLLLGLGAGDPRVTLITSVTRVPGSDGLVEVRFAVLSEGQELSTMLGASWSLLSHTVLARGPEP